MNDRKNKQILIADDMQDNREILSVILEDLGYATITANDGVEAVKKATENIPDLVILDIMMPNMDGFEACKKIKANSSTAHLPVIIVSALTDTEKRIEGLQAGANDFISKPFNRVELTVRVKNLIKIKEYNDFMANHNKLLKEEVDAKTSDLKKAFEDLDRSHELLQQGHIETIERLTIVSEFKDHDTADHIRRVGLYCAFLAETLGWDADKIDTIRNASPLHDIGKVAIPAEVLLKPGALTEAEFALMKTHTIAGGAILEGAVSKYLVMAKDIALTHHERFDGSGYPNGLKGEKIPIASRIMNIADQYDALRCTRPYKLGLDHEKVYEIITVGDGRTDASHFDPKILDLFREHHNKFNEIYTNSIQNDG
jgi:putative two-component system response regulator